jgi:hypothetical protein
MEQVLFNPLCIGTRQPGANLTIASYNASAVKIYNATSSLVRFESKNTFFGISKNALAYCNAGVVVVCIFRS